MLSFISRSDSTCAFERAAFLVERAQLRIGGQRIALARGAERQQRGDPPFLAVGRRLADAFLVAAVVEQGVLGQHDALPLVGGRDLARAKSNASSTLTLRFLSASAASDASASTK